MGLFDQRTDYTSRQAISLGGAPTNYEITREWPIEAIFVRVTGKVTAAGTGVKDRLGALLKRATLTCSDGARPRTVLDCSGPGLIEWSMVNNGWLDQETLLQQSRDIVVTQFSYSWPIYFCHPKVIEPLRPTMLLPAPRFNSNPVLSLEWASSIGAGTTIANCNVDLFIVRQEVTDPNWTYFDHELVETQYDFSSTGINRMELPVGGSYTGLLLRGYPTATTRGDVSQTASRGHAEWRLAMLGNNFRRFTWDHQRILAQQGYYSRFGDNSFDTRSDDGSTNPVQVDYQAYCWIPFLTNHMGDSVGDFTSCMDTNPLMATGARVELFGDVQTGSSLKIVHQRIFGLLDAAKLRR